MSYEAIVLADSVAPNGARLTTVQVTFPRFILAEVNTHRMLSRNSASSRAIPPEKLIKRVEENPFIPETFNARVKGMGVGNKVDPNKQDICRLAWLDSRASAVSAAMALIRMDVDKSRINRLLEPFMWHTAIITATNWDNFFALRCPPGEEVDTEFPAQLEFQYTALAMRTAMRASDPNRLTVGSWHLPLMPTSEVLDVPYPSKHDPMWERTTCAMISAGRCARVSYDTHEDAEPASKSLERAERLRDSGHMSPFEHQAMASNEERYSGNLWSWQQFRKMLPNESNALGANRLSWEHPHA